MATSKMHLSNTEYIATDAVSEGGTTVHRQRVIVEESTLAASIGVSPGGQLLAGKLAWISGPQDGTDASSMRVAGAPGTKGVFRYTVPAGQELVVTAIELYAADETAPTETNFLGIPALANGLEVDLQNSLSAVLANLATGPNDVAAGFTTIKRNLDFFLAGWELTRPLAQITLARWRAPHGLPYLAAGSKVEVRVADNLGALVELRGVVRGRLMTAPV